jgi:hypothetical protein
MDRDPNVIFRPRKLSKHGPSLRSKTSIKQGLKQEEKDFFFIFKNIKI